MATEQEILTSLGITDTTTQNEIVNGTKRLLILDASAHLDWDWLLPFPVLLSGGTGQRADWYFNQAQAYPAGPVSKIFDNAAGLLAQTAYHYSICEIGFLRGFANANPAEFNTLITEAVSNGNLRIAGGGITSPDSLVTHGETFIRNFLVGHTWLAANCGGLPAIMTVWIPDDFGHDPQLPVVVQALGFMAAGFARVPGTGKSPAQTISGGASLATILENEKIDFIWTAANSSIIAHWLIGNYCQGNQVNNNIDITTYLDLNLKPSPTPYVYVPVLCDFALPNSNLVTVVSQWNESPPSPYANAILANGSFEDYAQLLQFHSSELEAPYGASFNANPYYTGCYGSRPELKIRHQRASRNLLAAELFSVIASWIEPQGGTAAAGTGASQSQLLFDAWDLLVPSTHHDYITGTAIPDVFHTEQLTLLRQADATAKWLVRDAMDTIAGSINLNPTPYTAVVVFNPLGFQRNEIVELTAESVANASISVPGRPGYQSTPEGGLLFMAAAPSLGYQTAYLGDASGPENPALVTPSTNPVTAKSVTLSNGLVSATLTPDANGIWGLTSVVDLATNKQLIQTGAIANDLLFYADGGDEYQFGNESVPPVWQLTNVTSKLSKPTIEIVEAGPLRVTVCTSVTYDDGPTTIDYVREYILLADEPMLRMRATGAAPMLPTSGYPGCSVVVAFPLVAGANGIDTIVRGTQYHWTDVMPGWIEPTQIYWNDQTFLPTHNFVIPQSSSVALCALYHSDIPAWGISNQWNGNSFDPNNGILYGCLWRNGDGHYFEWVSYSGTPLAQGTDAELHVREYALRMPSTLQAAQTGGPLREALAFRSPLLGVVASPWTAELPDSLSLASSSPDSAIITAVKSGTVNSDDIIFRVYQPTTASLPITLTLDSHLNPSGNSPIVAHGQTALEQDLSASAESALDPQMTSNTITFTAVTALTTLAVTP